MWWSRSTNEGCYLFVVGWFRKYPEFFSYVVEDNAHNDLILIVNVQKSECHLDDEVLVSTSDVATSIDFRGKEFTQMIMIRRFRRAIVHLFFPCFTFKMLQKGLWLKRQLNSFDRFKLAVNFLIHRVIANLRTKPSVLSLLFEYVIFIDY